jgi:hypothetical protein
MPKRQLLTERGVHDPGRFLFSETAVDGTEIGKEIGPDPPNLVRVKGVLAGTVQ